MGVSRLIDLITYRFKNICKINDVGYILVNMGHDIGNLPAFSLHVLPQVLVRMRRKGDTAGRSERENFYFPLMPCLYQGLLWDFQVFKQALTGDFPQERETDVGRVLSVVTAESAIRAGERGFPTDYDGLKIGGTQAKKIAIRTCIQNSLVLTGNEPALHLLFYQMIKNAVRLLKNPHIKYDGQLNLDAKKCQLANGQEVIAVRLQDNGPGIDITSILRAKQRLLKASGQPSTEKEQRIVGDWTALDLRIVDVVNFIFERRVSGADIGGSHGGIGLAMAKEIIDRHGGCVWATNLSGERGAKFLVTLDPSDDGSLKQNVPGLFQTEQIPVEILEAIDRQLDQ